MIANFGSMPLEDNHVYMTWMHTLGVASYKIYRSVDLGAYVEIASISADVYDELNGTGDMMDYSDTDFDTVSPERVLEYRIFAYDSLGVRISEDIVSSVIDIAERPSFNYAIADYMRSLFEDSEEFDAVNIVFPASTALHKMKMPECIEAARTHGTPAMFISQGSHFMINPGGLLANTHGTNRMAADAVCEPVLTLLLSHTNTKVLELIASRLMARLDILWGTNIREGVQGAPFDDLGIQNSNPPVRTFICEYLDGYEDSHEPKSKDGTPSGRHYKRIVYFVRTIVWRGRAEAVNPLIAAQILVESNTNEAQIIVDSPRYQTQILVLAGSQGVNVRQEGATGVVAVNIRQDSASGVVNIHADEEGPLSGTVAINVQTDGA